MTVKELIAELQKCDPEAQVSCCYDLPLKPGTDEVDCEWFEPTWVQEHPATRMEVPSGCLGPKTVWVRQ